jgi:5,10-methylenetetrahydromethanopterin reductase
VRALLDGQLCQMIQLPGFGPPRPINVPLWVAASGPKGFTAARELDAPGVVMTSVPAKGNRGWAQCALLRFGTILRPGGR